MNPFMDPDGRFVVVANDEEQHSLWPTFVPVPNGWRTVFTENTRQACLDYVERQWPEIRPRSLRERIAAGHG